MPQFPKPLVSDVDLVNLVEIILVEDLEKVMEDFIL